MAEHGAPNRIGKRFFCLEAKAIAGYDPANPLDPCRWDQASCSDDREEGLATPGVTAARMSVISDASPRAIAAKRFARAAGGLATGAF